MVISDASAREQIPKRSISYGTVSEADVQHQEVLEIQENRPPFRKLFSKSTSLGLIIALLLSGVLVFVTFQDDIKNVQYHIEEGIINVRRLFGEVIEEREFDFAIEARANYPLVSELNKPKYTELRRNLFLVKWRSTRVENNFIYRHLTFCPRGMDAIRCNCLPAPCLRVVRNQKVSTKNHRFACRCKWFSEFHHGNERYCTTTPKLKISCKRSSYRY